MSSSQSRCPQQRAEESGEPPLGEPTHAELETLTATLAPGEQRAVGGGIYLRVDGSGRMRFQFRLRSAGAHSRNAGGTYDGWEEAERARRAARARKETGSPEGKALLRGLLLSEYASGYWWAHHVALNCDAVTQLNYKQALKLIDEYFRGFRLEELSEEAVDDFARWLKARKTDKKTKRFYRSSYFGRSTSSSRILNHAVENRVLEHNPALTRKRAHRRRRGQPKVKPVRRGDVKHPRGVERVRLGVRGVALEPFMFRAAIDPIAWEGLRPSEALALRHEHWRDEAGPLSHIDVDAAIKNIGGRLFEDETKTDTRQRCRRLLTCGVRSSRGRCELADPPTSGSGNSRRGGEYSSVCLLTVEAVLRDISLPDQRVAGPAAATGKANWSPFPASAPRSVVGMRRLSVTLDYRGAPRSTTGSTNLRETTSKRKIRGRGDSASSSATSVVRWASQLA